MSQRMLKTIPQLIIAAILFVLGILQIQSSKMLFVGLLFHQVNLQSPANIFAAAAFFSFSLSLVSLLSEKKLLQSAGLYLFVGGFVMIGVATFINP